MQQTAFHTPQLLYFGPLESFLLVYLFSYYPANFLPHDILFVYWVRVRVVVRVVCFAITIHISSASKAVDQCSAKGCVLSAFCFADVCFCKRLEVQTCLQFEFQHVSDPDFMTKQTLRLTHERHCRRAFGDQLAPVPLEPITRVVA